MAPSHDIATSPCHLVPALTMPALMPHRRVAGNPVCDRCVLHPRAVRVRVSRDSHVEASSPWPLMRALVPLTIEQSHCIAGAVATRRRLDGS